ncbi:peptidyl-prolyl cis-trans isomerase [Solimonas sp. K1W22B-7]|uniref:peptidylprolyl isomerase n=1 Tax=Solimonas sp. K1W22B-7 TaxID=2303331 RepID=UPI000E3337F4|nr:peptidylprolyl isomerase [Solimonas sp. K1W22B-7]AXQ27774.1 peptidyl-prolyl cis-trans isomerase [Solimonas sp. K1W22B-7]
MQRFLDALSRLQQRHALLLFLGLGALLFAVDGLRQRGESLTPPTASAEGQTAEQWLEDEVLYREAIARGLGEGDLIVRRRLVQKMRLLLETGVDVAEPSDRQLRDWVGVHAGRYGGLERLSFEHVFLSRGLRDAHLASDAAALGAVLQADPGDLDKLSDPHPGGTHPAALSQRDVERMFGTPFSMLLAELPQGQWQGPLPSAMGLHFVRIRDRRLAQPDYAAVRERAQRDYLLERRAEETRLAVQQLKTRYGLDTGRGTP